MDNEPVVVPAEELAAEQAAVVLPKQEDVRTAVIAELGFDPEADAEKIDKVVKQRMDSAEKLSKAIGQKINFRTKFQEATKPPPKKDEPPAPNAPALSSQDVLDLTTAAVHKDDIEMVIKFARFEKVSVAEALKNPMLTGMIQTATEHRASAAAADTGNGARGDGTISGGELLSKAEKGEVIPETAEAHQSVFLARRARHTKK